MDSENVFIISLCFCIVLFFGVTFGAMSYGYTVDAQILTACLNAGHPPVECATLIR